MENNLVLVTAAHYLKILEVRRIADAANLELRHSSDFQSPEEDRQRVCALMVDAEPVTVEVMARFPNLRTIARTGTGYDSVDIEVAKERRILVSRVTHVAAEFVSEFVVGTVLALFRNIVRAHDRLVYHSEWSRQPNLALGDATIGILGLGHIGCRTAQRFAGLGVKRLLGWNRTVRPFVLETIERTALTMVPLEKVMAESDAVVVCLALNPGTRGLVSKERIALMKPQSFLVNVGRGAVVDETALACAISESRIAGAALDVYSIEGQQLLGQRFFQDLQTLASAGRNIVLTPHFASSTTSATERGITATMQNIVKVLAGRLELVELVTGD